SASAGHHLADLWAHTASYLGGALGGIVVMVRVWRSRPGGRGPTEPYPLTESGGLTSEDPDPMLAAVGEQASPRALRLFACACCRLIWPLLGDQGSWQAVETAERFADGLADREEMSRAGRAAWAAAARATCLPEARDAADHAALAAAFLAVYGTTGLTDHWTEATISEKRNQAALLRDLLGNPFRGPPALDPAWLAGQEGGVRRVAGWVYEGRHFEDLPIVADALEEAGCTDE